MSQLKNSCEQMVVHELMDHTVETFLPSYNVNQMDIKRNSNGKVRGTNRRTTFQFFSQSVLGALRSFRFFSPNYR